MGANRPFSPPDSFWRNRAVLFVARSTYAGSASDVLAPRRVVRDGPNIIFDYTFSPASRSSSTIASWTGAVVEKPLPAHVVFRENGRTVCTVRLRPDERR